MGVAEALRRVYPDVKAVAVEPAESAVMIRGKASSHIIQRIGPGFIPSLVDMPLIGEVVKVRSSDAVDMTRRLIKDEGLMVGVSSGAKVLAALKVAQREVLSKSV